MTRMTWRTKIKTLRDDGAKPRVHGNGFIQLDIDNHTRFNFWGHPETPRQKSPSPIHNHRFGFVSEILLGRIVNIEYSFFFHDGDDDNYNIGKDTHKVYRTVINEGEDTRLVQQPQLASGFYADVEVYWPGEHYRMNALDYHETVAPIPTITRMHKDISRSLEEPMVLIPLHREPDNEFNRHNYMNEMLWRIIQETVDS